MCLGVPGRIVSVGDDEMRMGKVAFGGIRREVCLTCVPEAGVGDWVIIHAGFAISQLSEEEAQKTLDYLAELGELEALGPEEEVRGQVPLSVEGHRPEQEQEQEGSGGEG